MSPAIFVLAATGVLQPFSGNDFRPQAGLPGCMKVAVESGDPASGASVIAAKADAGCTVPWHWHTPTEKVMIVTGSAKIEMKDLGKAATLGAGGFAMMPSKHQHQFTCTTACSFFVDSDGAFDIHYVDAAGNEIAAGKALGKPAAKAR
jgi:quercetin dioxygenase-like cupin family protein